MTCPMCNADNPGFARYCMACGGELVATPSREDRHATQPLATERPKYEQLLETAFRSYERGEFSEAILAAEAALALEPSSSAARSLLGIIYEKKGDLRKAIEQFERVVELNPTSQSDRDKLEALRLRAVSLTSKAAKSKLTEGVWLRIASPLILGVLGGAIVFAVLWAIMARGAGDRAAVGAGATGQNAAPQVGAAAPQRTVDLGPAAPQPTLGSQPPQSTSRPNASQGGGTTVWGGGVTPFPFAGTTGQGQGYSDLVAVQPPTRGGEETTKPRTGSSPKGENQISLVIEELNPQTTTKQPNVEVIVPGGSSSGREGSAGPTSLSPGQYEHRGEMYHRSGMYSDALDSYQKAFNQRPSWDLAQRMAMCYERLGQNQSAADYYRRARGLAESDVQNGRRVEEAKQALRTIDSALELLSGKQ
jgi:tetratricopeptide (TPR) repeat protein